MTENIYSAYSLATGIFSGITIKCEPVDLDANIPDGCGCVLGEYYSLSQKVDIKTGLVVDYQPPNPSGSSRSNKETRRIAAEVRAERDRLLAQSDWISLRAAEGIPMPNAWEKYRAALRDITGQPGFPHNVAWPVKPEGK